MIDKTLGTDKKLIPSSIFNALSPIYHWKLAFLSALWYGFPSRHIKIIAVTGTKGKSSTTEILNAILEEAGYKTALSNTIRFKIAEQSRPNLYKMSMPGRGFMQKLLRQAVNAGCEYMIMEMTSQGALLFRHRFIKLDMLVVTNVSPEHIEAHGSYEKYLDSKLSIARSLAQSSKNNRAIIVNSDDKEADLFIAHAKGVERTISYNIKDAGDYSLVQNGIDIKLFDQRVHSNLQGLFNLYNILAALTAARALGVSDDVSIRAIETFSDIPGRVQKIISSKGFEVVVDYAHTPDSLEKFYQVFKKENADQSGPKNICILGGTGGGRDTWKRGEMGRIAGTYCQEIILTDEDPYDEDPRKIVDDVASGIKNRKPTIIMDRREAIRAAIAHANPGDSILITGKGTDPYIMGPNGTKTPWSDAKIVQEELDALHDK